MLNPAIIVIICIISYIIFGFFGVFLACCAYKLNNHSIPQLNIEGVDDLIYLCLFYFIPLTNLIFMCAILGIFIWICAIKFIRWFVCK